MASPPAGLALRVESGSQAGRTVPVGGHALVIGRDPEADLVLDDDLVSRRHAALVADGSAGLLLRDLSSTNGTWLDDRRVEGAASVSAGARIRIGATWLAIVEREVAPPAAAATSMDQSGGRRLQEELRHGNRRVMVLTVGVAVSLLLVIVLAATVLTGRRSPAADRSPADIAAEAKPGTVQVRGQLDGRQVAAGSGWVLDADQGLVVTQPPRGQRRLVVHGGGGRPRPGGAAGRDGSLRRSGPTRRRRPGGHAGAAAGRAGRPAAGRPGGGARVSSQRGIRQLADHHRRGGVGRTDHRRGRTVVQRGALSEFRRGDQVAMSIVQPTSTVDPEPLDRPRVRVVDLPLLG